MDEEKEKLIEELVTLLKNYRLHRAFHSDMRKIDREIRRLIKQIKNL